MPSILIETRQEYNTETEVGIMDAVHSALIDCFKILPHDKNIRLISHPAHRFACPPKCDKPDYYTHISIDCFAGRSLDAKRKLYQTIVHNLEAYGIPKDHVKIMLREISAENWGIRAGQAACDVQLGYQINI